MRDAAIHDFQLLVSPRELCPDGTHPRIALWWGASVITTSQVMKDTSVRKSVSMFGTARLKMQLALAPPIEKQLYTQSPFWHLQGLVGKHVLIDSYTGTVLQSVVR